jgi:hypothetical protein
VRLANPAFEIQDGQDAGAGIRVGGHVQPTLARVHLCPNRRQNG